MSWIHILATQNPRCSGHCDKTRNRCDFYPFGREAEPDHRYLKMTAINSTDIFVESVTAGTSDGEKGRKDVPAQRRRAVGRKEKQVKPPWYGRGTPVEESGRGDPGLTRTSLGGWVGASQMDRLGRAFQEEGQRAAFLRAPRHEGCMELGKGDTE